MPTGIFHIKTFAKITISCYNENTRSYNREYIRHKGEICAKEKYAFLYCRYCLPY